MRYITDIVWIAEHSSPADSLTKLACNNALQMIVTKGIYNPVKEA